METLKIVPQVLNFLGLLLCLASSFMLNNWSLNDRIVGRVMKTRHIRTQQGVEQYQKVGMRMV